MIRSASDAMILSTTIFLLVVRVIFLLHDSTISELWRAFVSTALCFWSPAKKLDVSVAVRVNQKRERLSLALFEPIRCMLLFACAITSFQIITSMERKISIIIEAASLITLIVAMRLGNSADNVDKRCLQYWYGLVMTLGLLMVAPRINEEDEVMNMYRLFVIPFWVVLLLVYRAPMAILFMTLFELLSWLSMAPLEGDDLVDALFIRVRDCVMHVGCLAAGSRLLDRTLAAWGAAELKAEFITSERSATSQLLEKICDVVVELDSDLQLTAHSASLAAILMLSSGRSLAGTRLQDFMADELERENIERSFALADSAAGTCGADIFHGTMRDSNGGSLRMEFVSVSFKELCEDTAYIVGIRGFTDAPGLLRRQSSRMQAAFRSRGRRPTGNSSISSRSSRSSRRSSRSRSWPTERLPRPEQLGLSALAAAVPPPASTPPSPRPRRETLARSLSAPVASTLGAPFADTSAPVGGAAAAPAPPPLPQKRKSESTKAEQRPKQRGAGVEPSSTEAETTTEGEARRRRLEEEEDEDSDEEGEESEELGRSEEGEDGGWASGAAAATAPATSTTSRSGSKSGGSSAAEAAAARQQRMLQL